MAQRFSQLTEQVIDLDSYEGFCISGLKGWGKSAMAEVLGETYFLHGWIVLDVLGAPDWESAFWAIPGSQGCYYKTLLIHPPFYELKHTDPVRWGHIKFMSSDTPLLDILKTAKNEDRVITTASLWPRGAIAKVLTDWFWELPEIVAHLKTPVFLVLKEAHMAFSHLRVFEKLETKFRAALLNIYRQGRHHEIGFVLDLQRMISLYKEIRDLTDKTILKHGTRRSIPAELSWVFTALKTIRDQFSHRQWKLRERNYPEIQRLWKSECYCLDAEETILPVIRTPLPRFHHKRPRDRFLEITQIQVIKRGEPDLFLDEEDLPPVKERLYQWFVKNPNGNPNQAAKALDCDKSYAYKVFNDALATNL